MTDYLAKTQALHSRVQDLTSGDSELNISDKLFAVVLVNSLPRPKYSTVIQQLLASIKTLSTSQVITRLWLEASSMASDEERFKDVYAAKATKPDNCKVGPRLNDLCNVHQNLKHTNAQCFTQKYKSSVKKPKDVSDDDIIKRYHALMSSKDMKSVNKTIATAEVTSGTDEDKYIT